MANAACGVRVRCFPESNYKAIYSNGKTMRIPLDKYKPITELEYPEFLDVCVTYFCRGACPYCFSPGTKVNTPNGLVPIESLQVGDAVLGYTEKSLSAESQEVAQVFEREYVGEIVTLLLEDNKSIQVTPNHK